MLQRYRPMAYSIMRCVVGALFACHGAQKLFGALGGKVALNDPENVVAGIVEFVGGSLIALGAFASIAALVACGEMAVAYFKAHAPRGFWPIQNRGELAVLYCFVFLFVIFQGDGVWSLRALWRRNKLEAAEYERSI